MNNLFKNSFEKVAGAVFSDRKIFRNPNEASETENALRIAASAGVGTYIGHKGFGLKGAIAGGVFGTATSLAIQKLLEKKFEKKASLVSSLSKVKAAVNPIAKKFKPTKVKTPKSVGGVFGPGSFK